MIYIPILVVVSGLIAYLGDRLGAYAGKKRLSLFGLRPRSTALVFAVATGVLIALLTLGLLTGLSEDVRTALFSMRQIQSDLARLKRQTEILSETKHVLEQDKTNLKKEKLALSADIKKLQSIVRLKKNESVVFRKDEPLAVTVIKTGKTKAEVMKDLTELIISLSSKARAGGIKVSDEIAFFTANKEQLDKMALYIAGSSEDFVVGAVAAENINAGERLGNVRFIILPNKLIFLKGQDIASLPIDGRLSRGRIVQELKVFMDEINQEVVRLGMISNPLTGRFGDLSSESMISFYDMVNGIKELNRPVILIAIAPEDTYAIGPLNLSFRFEETDGANVVKEEAMPYTASNTKGVFAAQSEPLAGTNASSSEDIGENK